MIRITLKSDSVSTLEPGLQFSNARGRENNEKVATWPGWKITGVSWIWLAKGKIEFRAIFKIELMELIIGLKKWKMREMDLKMISGFLATTTG